MLPIGYRQASRSIFDRLDIGRSRGFAASRKVSAHLSLRERQLERTIFFSPPSKGRCLSRPPQRQGRKIEMVLPHLMRLTAVPSGEVDQISFRDHTWIAKWPTEALCCRRPATPFIDSFCRSRTFRAADLIDRIWSLGTFTVTSRFDLHLPAGGRVAITLIGGCAHSDGPRATSCSGRSRQG